MTTKRNSFMGITSDGAITVSNSAMGGDAFDAITLTGTGVGVTVNTSADVTDAYDRGILCNVNSQAYAEAMVRWNHTALSTTYHRFYFRTFATHPTVNVRLLRGYSNTTQRWELRYIANTGHIALYNDAGTSESLIQTTSGVSANTIYRVEIKVDVDADNCVLNVYTGESTSSPAATTTYSASANITGSWDNTRYGQASGSTGQGTSVEMAGVAWSDTGLIGAASASSAPDVGYCATLGRALQFDGGTLEGIGYTEGTTAPAASTDVAYSGTYSMKCTIPAGASNGRSLGQFNNAANTMEHYFGDGAEAWFGWRMHFADFTPVDSYNYFFSWLHQSYTWGTSGMGLRFINNTSNIELAYNGGSNATGSLGAVLLDQWENWLVNIKFNQTNTIGEINVWRGGTQVVTALKPSGGTYDEGQTYGLGVRIGFNRDNTNTTLQTAYFDDFAVATTRAAAEPSALSSGSPVTYGRLITIGG